MKKTREDFAKEVGLEMTDFISSSGYDAAILVAKKFSEQETEIAYRKGYAKGIGKYYSIQNQKQKLINTCELAIDELEKIIDQNNLYSNMPEYLRESLNEIKGEK